MTRCVGAPGSADSATRSFLIMLYQKGARSKSVQLQSCPLDVRSGRERRCFRVVPEGCALRITSPIDADNSRREGHKRHHARTKGRSILVNDADQFLCIDALRSLMVSQCSSRPSFVTERD